MTSTVDIKHIMATGCRGYLVIATRDGRERERWGDGPLELQVSLEQAMTYWRLAGEAGTFRPSHVGLEDGTTISIHQSGEFTIAVAHTPPELRPLGVALRASRRLVSVDPAQAGI